MGEMNLFFLKGKRALATGGAMGIGMGIVRKFTDSGAKVLIATEPAKNIWRSFPRISGTLFL